MHTRATSDYTPTMPGSKDENAAIVARKEMMKVFASREYKPKPTRKTWRERMRQRTSNRFDSPQAIQNQQLKHLNKGGVLAIDFEIKPAKKAAKPRKSRAKVAAA